MQDLLLERNALLEHAYAMVAGSGQGPGSQPNGSRDRDAAGVDHEPTAWWLTQEMQVGAFEMLTSAFKRFLTGIFPLQLVEVHTWQCTRERTGENSS